MSSHRPAPASELVSSERRLAIPRPDPSQEPQVDAGVDVLVDQTRRPVAERHGHCARMVRARPRCGPLALSGRIDRRIGDGDDVGRRAVRSGRELEQALEAAPLADRAAVPRAVERVTTSISINVKPPRAATCAGPDERLPSISTSLERKNGPQRNGRRRATGRDASAARTAKGTTPTSGARV
jgi:hypothetical protein